MREELVDLRNLISGDLAMGRRPAKLRERITFWQGYIYGLRDIRRRELGRGSCAVPLSYDENKAFQKALMGYSGAGLSVQIKDADATDIEVIREPSPESPVLTPCIDFVTKSCGGNSKVVKPLLFKDDPRTRIKLGG